MRSHVLTYYTALGNDPSAGRHALLERPWAQWCETVLADLEQAHPDIRRKVRQIEIMRYGHAMAIRRPACAAAPGWRPCASRGAGGACPFRPVGLLGVRGGVSLGSAGRWGERRRRCIRG